MWNAQFRADDFEFFEKKIRPVLVVVTVLGTSDLGTSDPGRVQLDRTFDQFVPLNAR